MAAPINFVTGRQKAKEREQIREARQHILAKAKADFEKREQKKQKLKEQGEGTWMLPAVLDRVAKEEKNIAKVKSKKEKKEKKKNKKEKKHKRAKKHSKRGDSDSSSEEDGQVWVEKTSVKEEETPVVRGPQLQRDDWMMASSDLIPTVTRDELRERKKKALGIQEKVEPTIEEMGKHERELNPFWKDGGTGLPEEKPKKSKKDSKPSVVVGDCGVGWLKKAYERCKQQAEDEGRRLADIAAERYGSLEKLEKMLTDAEKKLALQKEKAVKEARQERDARRSSSSERMEHIYRSKDARERRIQEKDRQSREGDQSRSRERDRNRQRSRDRSHSKDCGRDRSRNSQGRSRDGDRSRGREGELSRDKDRNRNRHSRSRSSERYRSSSSRCMKPGDDSSSQLSKLSGRFKRPGDDDTHRNLSSTEAPGERLKKMGFLKPGADNHHNAGRASHKEGDRQRSSGTPSWKKSKLSPPLERKRHSSPESSSSGSSSSSESESEEEKVEERQALEPSEPVAEILDEKQLNALGAKLIRAEMMGNQEAADRIKTQLDEARNAKEARDAKRATASAAGGGLGGKGVAEEDEEGNVVVLTRTARSGMARPLAEQEYPTMGQGRRRKKQKVETHDKSGQRTQYFDDDSSHDLKALVEREKMGTAEDSNMMFARLAGRSMEKTDDDHQLDDVFVQRAAAKQSKAQEEARDRAMAIDEHRKMQAAMDSCHYCFSHIPKHLIVAIGTKAYLCLPSHKSMADGHCLIVPMQHVTSGTAMDEEVWEEIQLFRKALVRMWESQDLDCVFMETCMNLRRLPHMVLECVPLPREVGDMSPIYFKKAIMEVGPEWAQNKKLVDLKGRDVRKALPKQFPYFAVDFGLQSGYAHVIEDEKSFPSYFGREIAGGMLELDPTFWRKPKKEQFEEQRKKVLKFATDWKEYDWTQNLQS